MSSPTLQNQKEPIQREQSPEKVFKRIEFLRAPEQAGEPLVSRQFSDVTDDTRKVVADCIFVAIEGTQRDGHEYLETAVLGGATLLIGTRPRDWVQKQWGDRVSDRYYRVTSSGWAYSELAALFFGDPSLEMKVFGVTGTSGKTTSTYLVRDILEKRGLRTGIIGTIENRLGEYVWPSTHTTPGARDLQALLRTMRDLGAEAVVLEVSSHALVQKRGHAIRFDGGIFTNLSPEHLDYHRDMEDYFQSKALFLTEVLKRSKDLGKKPVLCVNAEDPYARRLQSIPGVPVSRYGLEKDCELVYSTVSVGIAGSEFEVRTAGFKGKGQISLSGEFNIQNAVGAVAVLIHPQQRVCAPAEALEALKNARAVPGRLEQVRDLETHKGEGIHVLVDYAHKPDALQKVLQMLQTTLKGQKPPGRLITVFGCGGDRDPHKRPKMGKIAAELSDWVWVTSDNPRTEDPLKIIEAIQGGIGGQSHVSIEPDRRQAIFRAIESANPGDVVLIAGKGHEDYQIVGKTKHPFDDRLIALSALKKRH